ncbi:hypothetical protein HPB51_022065 [Rhipicephalus microplus]|uniref:Uncharacterized protein n=1 Tax=Rhipicephalus microplus TaxID=6941 RepID=A0A9J6F832_RHIMP|nr:hypothetical protein HPB51_022065 [Rhipicephalus microplus]
MANVDQWSGADVRTRTNAGASAARLDLLLVKVAPDCCPVNYDATWHVSPIKKNDDGAAIFDAFDSSNRWISLVYDESCKLSIADVVLDIADHSIEIVAFGSSVHRYFVLFPVGVNVLESQDFESVGFIFDAHHNDVLRTRANGGVSTPSHA